MKMPISLFRTIATGIILIYITSFNNTSLASSGGPDDSINKVTTESIVENRAIAIDDKVFINWKITGLTKDCMFFIQRSVNSSVFETIEVKKGIGGDARLTVLYCFIDEEQLEGIVEYQIKQIDFVATSEDIYAVE